MRHTARAACKQTFILSIFFFLFLATLSLVHAAPGDLDTTFNTNGIVTTPIGQDDDLGISAALQPDGKIVVAGYTDSDPIAGVANINNDFLVLRYNSDGSLDTSFSADGMVITPIGSGNDLGRSVALQSDGKIVVAGFAYNGADDDFAVVRYNSDGSLDTTFDTDGIVTTPVGGSHDRAVGMALQSDGKIVVAGFTFNGANMDIAVVRYNSDGSLDTSFDTDGMVITPIGAGDEIASGVVLQPDGKILATGFSNNGTDLDIAVVRYNSDGSLDTSFDTDGIVTTPIGSNNDQGYSVAIQPDGKIVVGGQAENSTDSDYAVVRYNSDGSLDTSFDLDGIVTTPIGSGDDQGLSLTLQPDGKIVVAGFDESVTGQDFAVIRYNTDGSLDSTFSGDGIVSTSLGSGDDIGRSVVLQPDGKILVAGWYNNGTNFDVALVRYNGDAAPTVTTADVSSITSNSAVCGGEVTGDGSTGLGDIVNADVTARGVCWSTTANPTTADGTTADGSGVGAFTSNMTGLTPNTTYYVRAYATNFAGTSYGAEQTFTSTEDTGGGGGGGGGGGCFTGAVFHRP